MGNIDQYYLPDQSFRFRLIGEIILITVLGYSLSALVLELISPSPFNFKDILFLSVLSPYLMLRYLFVSHQFMPEWESICAYLGSFIWICSIYMNYQIKKHRVIILSLTFLGSFLWNLSANASFINFLSV